jgi:hypothetical protein
MAQLLSDGEINLAELRKNLSTYFSLDELNTLCFDLGIDFDNLGGETKEGKARELVKYSYRNGRLEELLKGAKQSKPNVDWEPVAPAELPIVEEPAGDEEPMQRLYSLVKAFNRNRHQPFTERRTAEGDDIAYAMREMAPALLEQFDAGAWLDSQNIGKRLAAVKYLDWYQDIEHFEKLLSMLAHERGFLQLHILVTLSSMVDQLDESYQRLLRDALSRYEVSADASRQFWKQRILKAL